MLDRVADIVRCVAYLSTILEYFGLAQMIRQAIIMEQREEDIALDNGSLFEESRMADSVRA